MEGGSEEVHGVCMCMCGEVKAFGDGNLSWD
jgi:hypothetical protein